MDWVNSIETQVRTGEIEIEPLEDTLCGEAHNNGEDTCFHCEMIKHNI